MWLLRIRIFQGLHVYVLAKLDYNDVSLWFDVVVRDMVSGNLITPGYLHERKSEEHGSCLKKCLREGA
ncbi:hypothetical protein VitviT2T_026502 [Vitis vinifera]|uniref:Uncharacterized protein n=1 Tax=Vitis vinifera TaxID=29760 RepID=A0ABY9DME5_VITVI|nr:hypothetical protein VitviT2T_026502 [Vitis vinifera]